MGKSYTMYCGYLSKNQLISGICFYKGFECDLSFVTYMYNVQCFVTYIYNVLWLSV